MKKFFLGIYLFAISILFFVGNEVYAATIPNGTVIYFDNSYLKWSEVNLYFWKEGGINSGWGNTSLKMDCSTNNICEYTLLNNPNQYDHLIFRPSDPESDKTIDLEFIRENYIFEINTGGLKARNGDWYIKDYRELVNKVWEFSELKEEWYNPSSYSALSTSIGLIPNTFSKSYLKVNLISGNYISNYETDLETIKTNFSSLVISPYKLENKITELENKNLTGYTLSSIISFRGVIEEAKGYINSGVYTVSLLESHYTKVVNAYNSLIITTEEEETAVIDKLKKDIFDLQNLLDTNSSDTKTILKLCSEIEALYEKLTKKESDLLKNVTKLLEENSNESDKSVIDFLQKELTDLDRLLESKADIDKVDNQFKELLKSNEELKRELKKKDKSNVILFLVLIIMLIEIPLLGYLIFKKIINVRIKY